MAMVLLFLKFQGAPDSQFVVISTTGAALISWFIIAEETLLDSFTKFIPTPHASIWVTVGSKLDTVHAFVMQGKNNKLVEDLVNYSPHPKLLYLIISTKVFVPKLDDLFSNWPDWEFFLKIQLHG
jgi:hypothetical protein